MRASYLSFLLLFQVFTSTLATDRHANCADWASAGECEKNPNYMLSNCADSCAHFAQEALEASKELEDISSFYDLSAKTLDGQTLDFRSLRGKVVILTNVASYCGYTESHYKGLVELWTQVHDKDVEILAFPCNQFGRQEPGTAADITKFAASKGVKFRMMAKIDVNGPTTHVVYKYLKHESQTPHIGWNFSTYFVVSPDGNVRALDGVEPMDIMPLALGLLNGEEL